MKTSQVLVETYVTLLRSPGNNDFGLHEDIGEALALGWKHGVISFDDYRRACAILRELGYNPNVGGQFDADINGKAIPEEDRWLVQREFLLFASRYARELGL